MRFAVCAGGGGSKKRGGTKGPSETTRVVETMMKQGHNPILVFSFSKRDCEARALQLSKMDFNDEDEKGYASWRTLPSTPACTVTLFGRCVSPLVC